MDKLLTVAASIISTICMISIEVSYWGKEKPDIFGLPKPISSVLGFRARCVLKWRRFRGQYPEIKNMHQGPFR